MLLNIYTNIQTCHFILIIQKIICDSLFLLDTNDILQNVLDLINTGSGVGGGGGITTLTGSGAAVITGTATSKNIQVDLGMYSTTTQINTLLAGKVDDGQVLTNVPLNASFSDTIYSKPSNEPISYITNLQTKLNANNDFGCWGKYHYFKH